LSGRKTFTAGEVLQAADVNDFLMDQSVMVFAGTAARGSAIPSPSEGMVTYREDDDVVEVYNGSSFVPVGPGQILQVVSTTKTDIFSTTSTSLVDVTGFSVNITPSSATSKVLVMIDTTIGNSTASSTVLQLVRDSTPIAVATGGSVSNNTVLTYSASANWGDGVGANFLDSPATTSSVTYKVQMFVASGTGHVGRPGVTADRGAVSTITVMEVAG